MQEERKKIVQFALDLEIEELRVYPGYKGDLIVKITTKNKEALMKVRKFALSLELLDVIIKQNTNLALYEVYCVTEDDDIYHIQSNNLLKDVDDFHPDNSEWGSAPL
jgi:hypothetical protein